MSKLGRAFMSLILDKKARERLNAPGPGGANSPRGGANSPVPPASAPLSPPRSEPTQAEIKARLDAKLDQVQNRPQRTASPTRQQLIQDALRTRSAKQDVFENLSPEQRLKLQVLAMKAMMPPKNG
jgi:hypothetical protein